MMIIIVAFLLGAIGLMASQTWLFVDWLMPSDSIVMKILTVIFFDVSAFMWACTDLFYPPATHGTELTVKSGMVMDLVLSILTTIFYFVIAYILKFSVHFPTSNLIIAMDIAVIFATVFNAVLLMVFFSIEWRFYHPIIRPWESEMEDEKQAYEDFIRNRNRVNKVVESAPELIEVSTNKPDFIPPVSTDKSIPLADTNKKKLPAMKDPVTRRQVIGGQESPDGKSQTKK
jgi:hypothetical protein